MNELNKETLMDREVTNRLDDDIVLAVE